MRTVHVVNSARLAPYVLLLAVCSIGCASDDKPSDTARDPAGEDGDDAQEEMSEREPPARDAAALRDATPAPVGDSGAQAERDGGMHVDAAQVDGGEPRRDAALDGAPSATRDATVDSTVDAAAASDAEAPTANCSASRPMPTALPLRGDLGAHDPVIIQADGQYHLFVTGRGIPTKRSSDLRNWQRAPAVFAQNPAWVSQRVPGATDLWAPDISQFGGLYHLYYSASTFGSNRSCIGHATRASLTSGSWQDRGPVICSNGGSERHDWNAIDPNVVLDESGTPWLSFGSFWSGLKLVKLTNEGARADETVHAIAGRNGGPIEAPFIVRRCGEYYLFVSFDKCCSGAKSTYRVMVGRSKSITGPYLDRAGTPLTRGGGTQILAGAGSWRGPGHNAVLLTPDGDYNVYHAYAAGDGHSELRIAELGWDEDGWPISGGP